MKKIRLTLTAFMLTIASVAMAQITEVGMASFYADKFDGKVTASGETFSQKKLTAAHRTLPFGTVVRVTNLDNNISVDVTVNDRGPFVDKRIIDLSKAAAEKLNFVAKGTASVKVEVISLPESNAASESEMKRGSSSPAWPGTQTNSSEQPVADVQTETTQRQTQVTEVQSPANEYFKIESTPIHPKGFGVQLASFQEAANLVKRCAEIKSLINKDIMIQIGDKDGVKVYRIIAGPFDTREKAEHFNKKLTDFSGSFIVTLE
ncbi:MAG: septal ring lytic transglycosylase RlpA family protein [Salinivirgaceae bacterium]|nr:septal ring lytic transglycosylase RlpA family protein [Salinivirgaceae bacterium]